MTETALKTKWQRAQFNKLLFLLPVDKASDPNVPADLIQIEPISYVHATSVGRGSNIDSYFQFFVVNYKSPKKAGAIDIELDAGTGNITGNNNQQYRQQEGCKFHIFTYNTGKYLYVDQKGNTSTAAQENNLFNQQGKNTDLFFQLKQNVIYHYIEEQAGEGDLLNYADIQFKIDSDNRINVLVNDKWVTNENFDDAPFENNLIKLCNGGDRLAQKLQIKHYPKLLKVYATFSETTETGESVSNSAGKYMEWTEVGYLGVASVRETWNKADPVFVEPAKLYRFCPTITAVKFMEVDVTNLNTYPQKPVQRVNPAIQLVPTNILYVGPNTGSFLYGGGTLGKADYKSYRPPIMRSCPSLFINDVLVHTGSDCEWSETGKPNFPKDADSNGFEYGHYFASLKNGEGCYDCWGGTLASTFWKRTFNNTNFYKMSTPFATDVGVNPTNNSVHLYIAGGDVTKQGIINCTNYLQKAQKQGEGTCLMIMRGDKPQYTQTWTIDGKEDHRISSDAKWGLGWAGVEDIAGAAEWAMESILTRVYGAYPGLERPIAPIKDTQTGCHPNANLLIANSQYENPESTLYMNPSVSCYTKNTEVVSPIMADGQVGINPNIAPIEEKAKVANEFVNIADRRQEWQNKQEAGMTAGCSIVVVFTKSVRNAAYFSFIGQSDPFYK